MLGGESLKRKDALCLNLEKALVGRQTDVITAFWRRGTEPSTLTASHQEDTNVTLSNSIEADCSEMLNFGRVCLAFDCVDHRRSRRRLDLMRFAGPGLFVCLDGRLEDLVDSCDIELVKLLSELCLLIGSESIPEGEEMRLSRLLVPLFET